MCTICWEQLSIEGYKVLKYLWMNILDCLQNYSDVIYLRKFHWVCLYMHICIYIDVSKVHICGTKFPRHLYTQNTKYRRENKKLTWTKNKERKKGRQAPFHMSADLTDQLVRPLAGIQEAAVDRNLLTSFGFPRRDLLPSCKSTNPAVHSEGLRLERVTREIESRSANRGAPIARWRRRRVWERDGGAAKTVPPLSSLRICRSSAGREKPPGALLDHVLATADFFFSRHPVPVEHATSNGAAVGAAYPYRFRVSCNEFVRKSQAFAGDFNLWMENFKLICCNFFYAMHRAWFEWSLSYFLSVVNRA